MEDVMKALSFHSHVKSYRVDQLAPYVPPAMKMQVEKQTRKQLSEEFPTSQLE